MLHAPPTGCMGSRTAGTMAHAQSTSARYAVRLIWTLFSWSRSNRSWSCTAYLMRMTLSHSWPDALWSMPECTAATQWAHQCQVSCNEDNQGSSPASVGNRPDMSCPDAVCAAGHFQNQLPPRTWCILLPWGADLDDGHTRIRHACRDAQTVLRTSRTQVICQPCLCSTGLRCSGSAFDHWAAASCRLCAMQWLWHLSC